MKKEAGDRIEDTNLKKKKKERKKENTFSSNIERKKSGSGQGGAVSFLGHLLCSRNRKI